MGITVSSPKVKPAESRPEPLEKEELFLKVPLHCEIGCKNDVEKALKQIKGVHTVNIDFAGQKARVVGNVDLGNLITELKKKTRKQAELWHQESDQKQKKQGKGRSKEKESNRKSSREEEKGTTKMLKVSATSGVENGNGTTGVNVKRVNNAAQPLKSALKKDKGKGERKKRVQFLLRVSKPEPLENKEWVLKVPLHCEIGCPKAVKNALKKIEGVESVDVDLGKQEVTVKVNVDSKNVDANTLIGELKRKTLKQAELLWPQKSDQKQKEQGKGKSKEKESNRKSSREEEKGTTKIMKVRAKSRVVNGNSTTDVNVMRVNNGEKRGKGKSKEKESNRKSSREEEKGTTKMMKVPAKSGVENGNSTTDVNVMRVNNGEKRGKGKSKEKERNRKSREEEKETMKMKVPAKSGVENGNNTTSVNVKRDNNGAPPLKSGLKNGKEKGKVKG